MKNTTTLSYGVDGQGRCYETQLRITIAPESTAHGRRWVADFDVQMDQHDRHLPNARELASMVAELGTKRVIELIRGFPAGADEAADLVILLSGTASEWNRAEWVKVHEMTFGATRATAAHVLEWGLADVANMLAAESMSLTPGATDLLMELISVLDIELT